jgi:aspartate carbamoyltransferase catalytic subunit
MDDNSILTGDGRLRHFTAAQQLDRELVAKLFKSADRLREEGHSKVLQGKTLVLLFYEPSTRTRLSFVSAMLKLGGTVVETENAKEFSSAIKGESLEDTIRVVQGYGDAVVVRHYMEGAADRMAALSSVPVINAGDGKGQHPTQALLDLYTIYREIGRLDKIKVAFVGDLAHGRTVRSLVYLLAKCGDAEMIFLSPDNLRIGEDIKQHLSKHGVKFTERTDLDAVLPEVDIVYMTRLQKERMSNEDFDKAKGRFIIDGSNFNLLKPNARLMHPLPKVDEVVLATEVENKDQRVAYFRQSANGLWIRMALLEHLLGVT